MNTLTKTLWMTVLGATCITAAFAQDASTPSDTQDRPRRVPPIVAALDANQDGVLDATEIANASRALLALDANKDGQLSIDELRPARPEGARGPGGPGGPGGRGGHRGGKGPRPQAPAAE